MTPSHIETHISSHHEALTDAEPSDFIRESSPDYRTAPIIEGFDWSAILKELARTRELGDKQYLVVFRSLRKPEANGELIARLDVAAHEEAMASDALFHYFAGELGEDGRALSWCLWTDGESARDALHGEAHKEAVRRAREFYEEFTIELYDVYQFCSGDELEVIFDRL